MRSGDLRAFCHLGFALWADPKEAETKIYNTLITVAAININQDLAIERATSALYRQVIRENLSINQSAHFALDQPFYRLTPDERFVLSALHGGRWSYAKIARILEKNLNQIAAIAWRARVCLTHTPSNSKSVYPTGSIKDGYCPVYIIEHPWTQKLLDDEMEHSEKIYIQNHLLGCTRCLEALKQARICYYQVEKFIPEVPNVDILISYLQKSYSETSKLVRPLEQSLATALWGFLKRQSAGWVFVGFSAFLLIKLLGRH
ncbi:MAG: hypothetical protein HY843_09295 [Bdellovibrio sp.]|nr:hypothetical protein [Bdellovibrio sp.]